MAARHRTGRAQVVGIGGSAGSLDALEQFFASAPADTGMAFVIVTHLEPDHEGLLPGLLQKTTAMPVRQIEDGVRIVADHVYVIPPGRTLALEDESLRVRPASRRRGVRTPIDGFFGSLARARGAAALGVVLSGTGADGADGLRAIEGAGGRVFVQAPDTAAFDAMPRAAIAATAGAIVAAADRLPAKIAATPGGTEEDPAASVRRVLEVLHQRTGHDLRQYKRAVIERRLERRCAVHHLETIAEYAGYLEANPDETVVLFRELMIGVTQFFRDDAPLDALRGGLLQTLLAAKPPPRALRVWVAGCSSGEEAYSLAIVVDEVLTELGAHDVAVQIYATDIDAGAIAAARAGRYSSEIVQHVAPARLARYFVREPDGFRIRKDVRDRIVFAEHDLVVDPPFIRLDLVSCRNVLIYLEPALQEQVLSRFHQALAPGGLLILGSAESASTNGKFAAVAAKARVFRTLDAITGARRIHDLPVIARTPFAGVAQGGPASVTEACRRVIAETVAPPAVLVNERGDVLYASRRTGRYLEPAVGKTNLNLLAMARDGLGPALGLALRQAVAKRRRVDRGGIAIRHGKGRLLVDLTLLPLSEPAQLSGLILVVFSETRRAPAGPAKRRGGAAGELARAQAHLQVMVREMEEAQAQLESVNEELQGTIEELQSTNEELTTSKEELQSLNEELQALVAELEAKNGELIISNDDLRNVLDSTKIPTLFLDGELRVKRFTSEVGRFVHLLPGDVGRALTDLVLRLDYTALAEDVADVLDRMVSKEVQVTGDDGTPYAMRIHPYRTMRNVIDGVVITFADTSGQVSRAIAGVP